MICRHPYTLTNQNITEFFQGLYNTKQLTLSCCVSCLYWHQFGGGEHNWPFACDITAPNCALEASLWINNSFEKFGYSRRAYFTTRFFIFLKAFSSTSEHLYLVISECELCKWRKNMCKSRPHIFLVVNKSHKSLHL